jgi:chromosome segregation ATPase
VKDLETKIDEIKEDIAEIKVTMAENTASLKEHMKRTALAEESITLIRQQLHQDNTAIKNELEPVKDHVRVVNIVTKVLFILGTVLVGMKELGLFNFLLKLLQ